MDIGKLIGRKTSSFVTDVGEFWRTVLFWEDESSAITYALNSKWVEIGDKHYCPDCAKNLAMN